MPSSYTSTFPQDILPDSGFLGTGPNGALVPLGATIGGVDFDPAKKIDNAKFDGQRSGIYLLDRIVEHGGKITTKLLQFGATNILVPEPGMISAGSGVGIVSATYTPKPGSGFFQAGDYLSDLRLIFERTAVNTWFQVHFLKALCVKYKLVSKDKDLSTFDVEFEPRLNLGVSGYTTDTAPYFFESLSCAQSAL